LLYGTNEFSLIGRPLLPENLIRIKAVLVDRRLDHLKVTGLFYKRRRFRKTYPYQDKMSIIRIKEIELDEKLFEKYCAEKLSE